MTNLEKVLAIGVLLLIGATSVTEVILAKKVGGGEPEEEQMVTIGDIEVPASQLAVTELRTEVSQVTQKLSLLETEFAKQQCLALSENVTLWTGDSCYDVKTDCTRVRGRLDCTQKPEPEEVEENDAP